MRTRRRENTGETGAAAVEFALVLPLLFVLLFGIIEFGFGLFQLQAAQASVREAARGVALGVENCGEVEDLVERAAQNSGLGIDPAEIGLTLRDHPAARRAGDTPRPRARRQRRPDDHVRAHAGLPADPVPG